MVHTHTHTHCSFLCVCVCVCVCVFLFRFKTKNTLSVSGQSHDWFYRSYRVFLCCTLLVGSGVIDSLAGFLVVKRGEIGRRLKVRTLPGAESLEIFSRER